MRPGAAACEIRLDLSSDWPHYPPIISDPVYGFILPEGTYYADDRVINVADGDTINLSCVGEAFEEADFGDDEFVAAT